jgi:hypothetical protein
LGLQQGADVTDEGLVDVDVGANLREGAQVQEHVFAD